MLAALWLCALGALGEQVAPSTLLPTPPSAAAWPARPSLAAMASLGGGAPGALTASLSAELGLLPLVAARLSATALALGPRPAPRARVAVLLGPALVLDVLAWVPRLFLQAGVALGRAAPALAWGAQIDRFVSLHTSVHLELRALYFGQEPVRGDLLLGVSYTH